jgi:hypothetical protein
VASSPSAAKLNLGSTAVHFACDDPVRSRLREAVNGQSFQSQIH